jgi:hypothetical protein
MQTVCNGHNKIQSQQGRLLLGLRGSSVWDGHARKTSKWATSHFIH